MDRMSLDEALAVAVEASEEEQTMPEAESSSDDAILIDSMDVVNDAGIDASEVPQPDAEAVLAAAPEQASDENDKKPKPAWLVGAVVGVAQKS